MARMRPASSAASAASATWWGPVWSPDGDRLAFFDDVDVPFGSQLVVNADGSGSPEQVDDVVVDGWIQG